MRAHERWIDVDGLMVHAAEWDARPRAADDEPVPLLLVHGLGGSTLNWDHVGGPLAERLGTLVTAIDLAGFGRTRPQGRPASLGTNGRLLAALLDERGPAVVVGNSMGGALGAGLAARRPDLVRSLVLVDSAMPRPRRSFEQLTRVARFAALTVPRLGAPIVAARARALGPAGVVDAMLAIVLAHPERLDPELRQRLVGLAAERAAYPEAAGSYAQAAGSLFRYLAMRMRDDIAAVRCPTMLVHGELDRLVPVSFARDVAVHRPDWELHVIEDCGHAPQLELPERVVDMVAPWIGATRAVQHTD